jgi:hypothetical protein
MTHNNPNQIWVLREFFLAYERFHGCFETKEAAKTCGPSGSNWKPIERELEKPNWDEADPFDSAPGSESVEIGESLWVVEPQDVRK